MTLSMTKHSSMLTNENLEAKLSGSLIVRLLKKIIDIQMGTADMVFSGIGSPGRYVGISNLLFVGNRLCTADTRYIGFHH